MSTSNSLPYIYNSKDTEPTHRIRIMGTKKTVYIKTKNMPCAMKTFSIALSILISLGILAFGILGSYFSSNIFLKGITKVIKKEFSKRAFLIITFSLSYIISLTLFFLLQQIIYNISKNYFCKETKKNAFLTALSCKSLKTIKKILEGAQISSQNLKNVLKSFPPNFSPKFSPSFTTVYKIIYLLNDSHFTQNEKAIVLKFNGLVNEDTENSTISFKENISFDAIKNNLLNMLENFETATEKTALKDTEPCF